MPTDVCAFVARVEVIARLDDMCGELLQQWIKKFKTRPQRVRLRTLCLQRSLTPTLSQIIFFRDGVSEGQFPQVLASGPYLSCCFSCSLSNAPFSFTEVNAIRVACQKIDREYKPCVGLSSPFEQR